MTKPVAITDQDFEQAVLKSSLPVVVDFWAPWCAPCRMAAPVVEELAQDYAGKVNFAKLNVDENHESAVKYSVRGIPTFLLFQGGKVITQVVGFRSKAEFKKVLDEALTAGKGK